MLGFIYKDIRTNSKWMWLVLGVLVVFNGLTTAAMLLDNNKDTLSVTEAPLFLTGFYSMAAFCSFVCAGAFAMNFVQTDERKKWGYYVVSLPNGRRKQVIAKYIFVAGSLGLTFGIVTAVNQISKAINTNVPDILSIAVALTGLELIMKAIEMPCIIAFGSKIGTQVKGGLMAVAVIFAAVYAMFGDLSWIGTEDSVWESIFKFISDFSFSRFGIIMILIAVPLYIISCLLSIRLYLCGIDRMEK
ncbi:MAG: ABC-2 transporter permease [Ruminococcus sp.]|nr:ABC-2 transporter permease [Ruminococcus sp.]